VADLKSPEVEIAETTMMTAGMELSIITPGARRIRKPSKTARR